METEFRYLLVRLGRQLHSHDCEGLMFVHKIPDIPSTKCDIGLHTLSSLEAMDFYNPLCPEKLQEILSKIGRKDLANEVKDYKQSPTFKKLIKTKKKAKKKGKDSDAVDERRASAKLLSGAAKLLSGAKNAVDQEERRWRDMFAMALTQTAQLVEQTELLRRAIEAHDNSEQTNHRIEEALHSILTAQDEVKSLSKTLKKAVSAAGLKSRKVSGENSEEELEGPQSPKLGRERANTYDGTSKSLAAVPKTLTAATPNGLKPIPTPTIPTQAVPVSTPTTSSIPTPTTSQFGPSPASSPKPIPITSSIPTKVGPAPSPKPKRSTKTPDFHHKLDSLLAGAVPSNRPTPPTTITHSNTFPSISTLSTTAAEQTSNTDNTDEGHIYDDPNLCQKEGEEVSSDDPTPSREETGGMYENSQLVCRSAEHQNTKGLTKQESEISIQVDSGLGSEDSSWGGDLINIKVKPQYVNLQIMDEYAGLQSKPSTSGTTGTEYTALNTKI